MGDYIDNGTPSRLYCEGARTQGVVTMYRVEYPYMRKRANESRESINHDSRAKPYVP